MFIERWTAIVRTKSPLTPMVALIGSMRWQANRRCAATCWPAWLVAAGSPLGASRSRRALRHPPRPRPSVDPSGDWFRHAPSRAGVKNIFACMCPTARFNRGRTRAGREPRTVSLPAPSFKAAPRSLHRAPTQAPGDSYVRIRNAPRQVGDSGQIHTCQTH